jgi:hypothetical protein
LFQLTRVLIGELVVTPILTALITEAIFISFEKVTVICGSSGTFSPFGVPLTNLGGAPLEATQKFWSR